MGHSEWCGEPCGSCEDICELDESMPCGPGCSNLVNDKPGKIECLNCDAILDNQKDELVDYLEEKGIVICPECNRGKVVRRDFFETLRTFDLERKNYEKENFVYLGHELNNEDLELRESFGECINCYTKFKSNPDSGVDLDNVI